MNQEKLTKVKDCFSIFQTVITFIAVCVGGLWTWHIFYLDDEASPHAALSQLVRHSKVNDSTRYVFVDFGIKNTGKTRLRLNCTLAEIRQISPISHDQEEILTTSKAKQTVNFPVIPWTTLQRAQHNFSSSEWIVGPGETDHLHAEFLIPKEVQVFQIFGYVVDYDTDHDCSQFPASDTGWVSLDTYDVNVPSGMSNSNETLEAVVASPAR